MTIFRELERTNHEDKIYRLNFSSSKPTMEISFSLLGRTEVLVVDTVEHEFLRSGDDSVMFLMKICQWITCILILATNVPLIIFIMKVKTSLEKKRKNE